MKKTFEGKLTGIKVLAYRHSPSPQWKLFKYYIMSPGGNEFVDVFLLDESPDEDIMVAVKEGLSLEVHDV